ncbi:LptE family protein [Saccharicrinis aurantiacus]|uniref:LptE family protein n=1 Tax=Saccharicrinis aurantiacus TaxID=1849719 RepID=UPI00094F54B0|nr:LptE family protein [Saccharicrinis aurantiacus]
MKQIFGYIFLFCIVASCSIKLTMNGASVPEGLKTFSVQYIENRAPLINPTLSQETTEALKDRVTNESRLILIERDADIDFSGEITAYSVRPMAIQADAISAETRLSMTVKIRYRNFKNPQDNWESSFTAYQDFSSEKNITEIESELTGLMLEQITEDIFNKAFSDW